MTGLPRKVTTRPPGSWLGSRVGSCPSMTAHHALALFSRLPGNRVARKKSRYAREAFEGKQAWPALPPFPGRGPSTGCPLRSPGRMDPQRAAVDINVDVRCRGRVDFL